MTTQAEDAKIPKAVTKRGGTLEEFSLESIADTIIGGAREVGGPGIDTDIAKDQAKIVAARLYEKYGKVFSSAVIEPEIFDVLIENGYEGTAWATHIHGKKKERARQNMGVIGSSSRKKNATDSFLMVGSASQERSTQWDRGRIVRSLINEADLDLKTAETVAEEAETQIFSSSIPNITTQLIREAVYSELLRRDLRTAANFYQNFSIPRADLEKLITDDMNENANISAKNPESINFALAGGIFKSYALSCVFSPDVAEAHSTGAVHLHDLDMITRVYCSAHSLEYLKAFGLKLKNLSSSSGPAKHAETLIGHLNTSLASMQTYYAGALGVGDINVFFAPHLKKDLELEAYKRIDVLKDEYERLKDRTTKLKTTEEVSQLEKLLIENEQRIKEFEANPLSMLKEKEISDFLQQRAQELIYNGSQNAFSRGGQTLFLDFNVHVGVPPHLRDTPIILDGKYQLRDRYGKLVALEKRELETKTRAGYNLMELVDPRTGEVVLRERLQQVGDKEHLVQDKTTKEGERIETYGHYEPIARRFTKSLLDIFRKGDSKGAPFAFPKCDFHINDEVLKEAEKDQSAPGSVGEILDLAYQTASENGGIYFVMDRDSVTMSACCRLRTSIDDDYVIKHPETMRFCGFQNVTINLPQAAYRAARKGKKTLEGFFEEIDASMEIARKAHLQKKAYITGLQKPGGAQWQTGDKSLDGQPYINLDKATYIIGILGLNDALKFITRKELHEMSGDELANYGLKTVAHMNIKSKEFGEQDHLKYSLEESPAESATRRFSLIDMAMFPEARECVKGNVESGDTFYTNSVHLAPNAPVDLVTRIKKQALFHSAIDSGAITHAFVGEQRPSEGAIRSLVGKTFYETQTAQLTISPEFTVCESCNSTSPKLAETCPKCDSPNVYGVSRIVGYYSKIPRWNSSKIEELKQRHEGNYFVTEGAPPESPAMPMLEGSEGPNSFVIHRFGKPHCNLCEGLGKTVGAMQTKYTKDGMHVKEIYHDLSTEDGMTQFMAARLNPSRMPAVVVMSNEGEIYRQDTNYRADGKANVITSNSITQGVQTYLQSKAPAS